jgi:hypothetical protein
MRDHRRKGTVLLHGRPLVHNLHSRGPDHLVLHQAHQAGFADPGITTHDRDLTAPVLDLDPALPQQCHLCLPSGERRQAVHAGNLQTVVDSRLTHHPVHGQRRGHVGEGLRVQCLQGHVAHDQPGRGGTAHHGPRLRHALEAGRQVGRLAQCQSVLVRTHRDRADDHRARVNADAHA